MLNEEKIALLNVGDELYVELFISNEYYIVMQNFLVMIPETRILKALGDKRNKKIQES